MLLFGKQWIKLNEVLCTNWQLKAHYFLINRTHLNLGPIHLTQGGQEAVSKNTN